MICTEVGCDPTQGLDFRGFSRMVDDEEAGSLASSPLGRAPFASLRVSNAPEVDFDLGRLVFSSCFLPFLKFVFVSFFLSKALPWIAMVPHSHWLHADTAKIRPRCNELEAGYLEDEEMVDILQSR